MATTNFTKYVEEELAKDPSLKNELDKAGFAIDIAVQIHALRRKRGLTQKQLAGVIGVKQSNIARLEDADYRGYSLQTLEKIAQALDALVDIIFTPKEEAQAIKKRIAFKPVLGPAT